MVIDQISPRNLPLLAFDSRARGFSTPLAHRRSRCPPSLPSLVLNPPTVHTCSNAHLLLPTRLSAIRCLSRAATSLWAPNWSSEEAHLVNTILNQPNLCCRSTDLLNRDDNLLATSVAGEFSSTPTGKTLPHSYPKTRFRRENTRMYVCMYVWLLLFIAEYGSIAGQVANSSRGRMNRENEHFPAVSVRV